jgi:aromatic-L-amino-acid decarboxylase
LWFLIREQGVEGLQARLRRDLANAKWLEQQIGAAANWRVLAPVPLQTLCVRHEPRSLVGAELDTHTLDWAARLNQSGQAYVTPAMLDGRWMVRVSIGAELTERPHVQRLWELMQDAVA